MTPARRAALRRQLRRLREADPERQIFGATGHHYKLVPRLREDEVAAFERRWQFELPAEYREFLIEVANGGAGPAYGLVSLGQTFYSEYGLPWEEVVRPTLPFRWAPDGQLLPSAATVDLEDGFEWPVHGAIPLADRGCGLTAWLVVRGPERGNVWLDNTTDREGFLPFQTRTQSRFSFLDWYQHWLDVAWREVHDLKCEARFSLEGWSRWVESRRTTQPTSPAYTSSTARFPPSASICREPPDTTTAVVHPPPALRCRSSIWR